MNTYRQVLYQIVFGTKHREQTLSPQHHEELYRINGMEDHLHIVSYLHPSTSLASYIKDIKLASSSWMKTSWNITR